MPMPVAHIIAHINSDRWSPRIDMKRRLGVLSNPTSEWEQFKDYSWFGDKDEPMMVGLRNCERITEETRWRIPETVFHVGRRRWKSLPDVITPAGQWIVSEKFHDIVERLDPDVHQFFPVTVVFAKTGEPYTETGQLYFWNVLHCRRIYELFDVDAMKDAGFFKSKSQTRNDGSTLTFVGIDFGPRDGLIQQSAFKHCNALWLKPGYDADGIFYNAVPTLYISANLHAALTAAKITGVEYIGVQVKE